MTKHTNLQVRSNKAKRGHVRFLVVESRVSAVCGVRKVVVERVTSGALRVRLRNLDQDQNDYFVIDYDEYERNAFKTRADAVVVATKCMMSRAHSLQAEAAQLSKACLDLLRSSDDA